MNQAYSDLLRKNHPKAVNKYTCGECRHFKYEDAAGMGYCEVHDTDCAYVGDVACGSDFDYREEVDDE